jgi:hypothetical protein
MKTCLQNQSSKSGDSKKIPEILREKSTASFICLAALSHDLATKYTSV